MTIALCVRCGAKKFGAFSNCARCGVYPGSSKDLAQSLMFSSHYYTFAELNEISVEIALTGKIPVVAQNTESKFIATIEKSPYLDILLEKPENSRSSEIHSKIRQQRTKPTRVVRKFILEALGRLGGRA